VQFYCIYITEAHPTDGWQVPANLQEKILFSQPATQEERINVASACMLGLDLAMPTLVDNMENTTNMAYAAIPEKLYLIDADGTVVFRTGPGPWFFDAEAWQDAIEELVAN